MEFEPATIVAEVLESFMPAANRKHVALKSSVGKDLPRVVKGDPERLGQVLVNLVSNAVRFTEKGEILLRVEATIAAEERPVLRFALRTRALGSARRSAIAYFNRSAIFIRSINRQDGIAGGNRKVWPLRFPRSWWS